MDYNISVTFAGAYSGGVMTAAAIRDALITLTTPDRLPVTALEGYVAGSTDTGDQIVTKLEALAAGSRLSATKLDDLIKTNVTGAEKALNLLDTGNVWSATFQTANPSADILAGDFFIASTINTGTNGTSIEDKDWVIALIANPGFTYTNSSKWLILKISKIPTKELAFRKYSDSQEGSGIMPVDLAEYKSYALAKYSLAIGYNCVTTTNSEGAFAMGDSAVSSRKGGHAMASGRFEVSGDAQIQNQVLRLITTNTTPTEMILPGPINIIGGKTYDFKIRLVARANGGAISKSFEWKALISFISGYGSMPAISTPVILSIGTSALSAAVTFSTGSPQRLVITCTGLSTPVRWVAYVEALEVYNADGTGTVIDVTLEGTEQIYVE